MKHEGSGYLIDAAWLQSIATGIVLLVVAGWIVYAVRRGQRLALWREGVARWTELGTVRPDGAGWRVSLRDGWARVRAGPFGISTVIVRGTDRRRVVGIASVEQLRGGDQEPPPTASSSAR